MLTEEYKAKAFARLEEMTANDFREMFKRIGAVELTNCSSEENTIAIIDKEISMLSQNGYTKITETAQENDSVYVLNNDFVLVA